MIDRILQFIDYKGISKLSFYKEVGLSNGFLDKNKSIGSEKLVKILNSYPEIEPLWLLLGQGEMLKKDINIVDNTNVNSNTNSIIGNNITGNTGNVTISISNEDVSRIIEQHKELTERLKTSQEQITTLLEIIKSTR
ncbi:transcriptional regulator [Capnocytophaga genosp. AHN8471]|jgi:putative phage repressor|uniref:Transcriptional regulator n=1 Tax=Capnocytophaga genosp. AHN8471 TaxID=327574 RepID=A0ABS1YX36_9FLAO|nr:transcriptional regulator [Capnocytophaga genosp. AHN8471]MBM0650977.1 transcriptional regulator [Capnocytophaga genosp. AHN8471]MBM0661641.1 transcriptional regulator [Capnocytophaga genosp. AHN8471]